MRRPGLSGAQLRIVKAIFAGHTTSKTLAEHLSVTERTVQSQLRDIFAKTGARNKVDLLLMALVYMPCEIDLARQLEDPRKPRLTR
jgi:DNA-binding CsgD family transcriptional regulator